jgi:arylsulfatase A-like enzyme
MTSLYVRNHGVVVGTDYFDDEGVHKVGANSFPLPDDIPLLSEAFSSIGYRTAGFIENSQINEAQGFGRGFDVYEKVKPAAGRLQEWLRTLTVDEPFFAYVHLIGPHDPYDGGQGRLFQREYRARFGEYDSSIDWTDLKYKKKVKQYSEQDLLQARAFYDAELNYFDQEEIAPLIA